MDSLKASVHEDAVKELNRANEKFPLFNSRHEAMAVIWGGYEDTKEAMEELQAALGCMWESTKKNRSGQVKPFAAAEFALNVAYKAIRTAAMLLKMEMSLGKAPDEIRVREEKAVG